MNALSDATIELLKEFNWKKINGPASFQEKLDGVPVRIIRQDGHSVPYTRQGEKIVSIPHILPYSDRLLREGGSIIGELYIPGVPFKDISGRVRKQKPDRDLKLYLFDADITNNPTLRYDVRRNQIQTLLGKLASFLGMAPADMPIQLIPGHTVYTEAEAEESFNQLMTLKPDAEGAVLHSLDKGFQPGKRCWGTQRLKPVPTIDLRVVGFEEAVSGKTGNGLGMTGRINCEFTRLHNGQPRTAIIGIGPGTMTHTERGITWIRQKQYIGKIAEVKYMRDDTYEALRQPTFFRWRDDKSKGQTA